MRLRSVLGHAAPALSITGSVLLVASVGVVPGRVGALAAPAAAAQPATCPEPATELEPATVAEVEDLLVGTWVLCGEGSVFGPVAEGEVGVQFLADGRFHRVYEGDDGGLVSAGGLDQEGTWSVADVSLGEVPPRFQVSLLRAGGGNGGPVTFYDGDVDGAELMELLGMDGPVGYVPWTGAEPEPGTPPGGDGPCGPAGDPVALEDEAAIVEAVVGTWILCDGVAPTTSPDGTEVGLQLEADGGWSYVFEQPDGTLVASRGASYEGTWSVSGDPLAITFDILGSGSNVAFPALTESPTVLRLTGMIGPGDYVPWTGAPPIPGPPPDATGECGVPTDVFTPTSAEDLAAQLVGVWVPCDADEPVLGFAFDSAVGFELVEDGRAMRLYRYGYGVMIRGPDAELRGPWTVTDISEANGRPAFQLSVDIGIGGTSGEVYLFDDPTVLRLIGMDGPVDYQRWTGRPPVDVVTYGDDGEVLSGTRPPTTIPNTTSTTVPTEVAGESVVAGGSTTLPRTGTGLGWVVVVAVATTSLGLIALGLARRTTV
ncbi:MAG: lipocalin family protein [Actinomycetota bacterium]|nr:lipocalin family protein [Actinomycetota bacterium]